MDITTFAHNGLNHVEVRVDPHGNVTPLPGIKLKSGLYTLASDLRTFTVKGDKIGRALTPLQHTLATSALQVTVDVVVRQSIE